MKDKDKTHFKSEQHQKQNMGAPTEYYYRPNTTTGWTTCSCGKEFEPGIVLDPFSGAATTLLAARDLQRSAIGIEISADYCKIAKKRVGFNQSTIDGSIKYIFDVI